MTSYGAPSDATGDFQQEFEPEDLVPSGWPQALCSVRRLLAFSRRPRKKLSSGRPPGVGDGGAPFSSRRGLEIFSQKFRDFIAAIVSPTQPVRRPPSGSFCRIGKVEKSLKQIAWLAISAPYCELYEGSKSCLWVLSGRSKRKIVQANDTRF